MPPIQLPLTLAQRHTNQQLFSDHYLNVTLPQRPEWKLLAHDAAQALAAIAPIVRAYVPSDNEAQTEEELIRPVLRALGHTFEVQAALKTPDGTKKPDYVFYRDLAALNANKNRTLDEALLHGKAFAVGDAKYWDRPLDQNLKRANVDAFTNKNPAYQIAFYIQHSGVEWGVLTNGRLWRLYHKDTAHKQDRFYEVDLPALVESNDAEAFLYFYAFFDRAAFEPGPISLDALLKESAAYARGVGESLKSQVYDALKELAQGFLDYPGNNLQTDAATLKQIYDNSLIVLYRLLFILYAEARELLPLRESAAYRDEYSLDVIKREIGRRKLTGAELLSTTARYWPRLKDLFGIINIGSPPLKVATFNGGLFDAAKHAFLERYTVGDARLIEALDKLARVDGQFVDYRDLAERHLGTIYEGLLEYTLQPIAPEGSFTVDLFNDRGERHRTGSYYTPDFVVQYIVDQTLRPVLDAAVAGKATDAAKIAAVLSVNCADPAMGSGHFPVAAMEYIARYLVDLGVPPDADAGGEPDLAYWKRRVAQNCIYGVDLNPLAVDLAKLSLWLATAAKGKPLSFLDHHLRCGNALVGARVADLNAGSAPKKARTAKKSQPVVGQISMLDDADFARSMGLAVGSMWLIEETAGNTLAEVREQERLYADLRADLTRKYQKLADVAVARDFGLSVDTTLWKGLSDYLARGGFEVPQYATVLKEAARQAAAQRFFHWDLEFPEVFFDRHGQPLGERGGFDAVIGNPPYVRQEQLAPIKPYLEQAYSETYHGMADLYIYFYQQGLQLLRQGGRMSYIVTNKWLRAGYGEPLRAFFAAQSSIEQIVDFGHAPIFEGADVFPCIIVLQKPAADESGQHDDHQVQVTAFPREALKLVQLDGYVRKYGHPVPQRRFTGAPWSLEASDIDDLMVKIKRAGMALTEFVGVKPGFGLKTGFNEAFVLDAKAKDQLLQEDPRSSEIIRPYLRGQDMERWEANWQDLWLIVLKSSGDHPWPWRNSGDSAEEIFQKTFPSIAPLTDATRAEVEPAVERLIAITRANQAARRDTLDWLRTEFAIESPGQKLEAFTTLNADAFVEEVRKRRPKAVGRLTPAALKDLRAGYAEQATPVQQRQSEALQLERRLADLVNQAYGLTPDEVELLWRTAPPRMPVGRV
jgi:type I restriction-modification system DNA methylase subunit